MLTHYLDVPGRREPRLFFDIAVSALERRGKAAPLGGAIPNSVGIPESVGVVKMVLSSPVPGASSYSMMKLSDALLSKDTDIVKFIGAISTPHFLDLHDALR